MKKKFCPECQKLGLKSVITAYGCTSTLLAINEYYDKEGNYHYDNPNSLSTNYRCSNGHEWSEID